MKTCSGCNETQPLDDFHRHARGAFGRRSRCKACDGEYKKARYASRPRLNLDIHLRRHYGITVETYDEMVDLQGGVCLICGRPPTTNGRRLAVDHDHDTGAIRGLLCTPCNSGIGQLGDSVDRLRSAIKYLEGSALCQG